MADRSAILRPIMTSSPTAAARTVVNTVEASPNVEAVICSWAAERQPAILESSRHDKTYGRFSIFACNPVSDFELPAGAAGCPLEHLANALTAYPSSPTPPPPVPFAGGWIGFLSYEAGLSSERIAHPAWDAAPVPFARFCLYDTVAVHDGRTGQWYVGGIDWPAGFADKRPPLAQRMRDVRTRLEDAERQGSSPLQFREATATLEPNMSRDAYLAKVAAIRRYIEAGDVYEVNLTRRFTTHTKASAVSLYRRLRRTDPSSHGALLIGREHSIISSSPELFLQLRAGAVVTRPIKGTRPRTGDAAIDHSHRIDLEQSPKERAELNMIVDLLRNDLGRVCRFGTVRVTEPGAVEEHPTVFHRVASIEGRLRANVRWPDLLRATCPAGSITGAPKIRAMQIISELEPTPRGVYCGSIGWIGLDGSMSMNVAIRTMLKHGDTVHAYAGSAIVADSCAESECEEIDAKLVGMARALGCHRENAQAMHALGEVGAL